MAAADTPSGTMGRLPDKQNSGLRMRRECWERFPRHRLQRKPLVSDPGMHNGTCVTHVPWCMLGSLTRSCGENAPGIPGACATHNFAAHGIDNNAFSNNNFNLEAHGIDSSEYTRLNLRWRRNSTTCALSVLRNDEKCKCISVFHQINLRE